MADSGAPRAGAGGPGAELARRIDLLEESYELFLAYAAQGSSGVGPGTSDARPREYLERSSAALEGIEELFRAQLASQGDAADHRVFLELLGRDATATRALFDLVRAQPVISSQLIDNLNASIHVRALLTDLFVLDEILRLTEAAGGPAAVPAR